ncbi:SNF2/RAD54 family helicase, partial [mine drainage metagenome]
MILSLKAGGTGINLTAASHVIHFDRWWNPATEDQATDRAYRISQFKPVQVHKLVSEGSIEEKISMMIARKRRLADSVLGSSQEWITELDDDQLTELVSLSDRGSDG